MVFYQYYFTANDQISAKNDIAEMKITGNAAMTPQVLLSSAESADILSVYKHCA